MSLAFQAYSTARWFPIPAKAINHPIQIELVKDISNESFRNYIIAAGRRSYKTERFLKRLFVQKALREENKIYFLGAPVRKQAKEIFWNDVKDLSKKIYVKSISETDLKIIYKNGCVLNVVGLKEFSTIEGGRAHGVGISEWQRCDPAVYDQTFQPMLNDTRGFCVKEFRPLGKNHAYDDYIKKNEGWKSYHWTAEDILDPIQILEAKNDLGEQDYNREYLASFETGSSDPYYAYSELNNKAYKPNWKLPTALTCDFNATDKPMSWVLGQKENVGGYDITNWFKAFSYQYTNTEKMCEVLDIYLKQELGDNYRITVRLYGDYRSGKAKQSNSSYTDWEIIHSYFANKIKFIDCYKSCTSIRDSIGATNAQMCNTLGIRKQFVNPETCKPLVLDWQKCEWADNQMELKEWETTEGVKRGHLCRAVDYYNDYEYPIKPKPRGYQA